MAEREVVAMRQPGKPQTVRGATFTLFADEVDDWHTAAAEGSNFAWFALGGDVRNYASFHVADLDAALSAVQALYRTVLDAKIRSLEGRRVRFDDGDEGVIQNVYPTFGENGVKPDWWLDVSVDGTVCEVPIGDVTVLPVEPA